MAFRKMLILRGNSAGPGKYPDEKGETPAWPLGALHVAAATEFARRLGWEPIVLDVPGQPQSQTSPQAAKALQIFLDDPGRALTAFYGFSGGGYNLWHILHYLAENNPDPLHRIRLVVVLGAPKRDKSEYDPFIYNTIATRTLAKRKLEWRPARWEVVYKTNPSQKDLPKNLPEDTDPHMFGPDVLLAETPAGIGRYRDWQVDDDC